MYAFYARMLPRLAARGALRIGFAQREGIDLAYHFGGVLRSTYRGLQHAYAEEAAGGSVGALLHAFMIESACREGVRSYDLGQETAYKSRWGEASFETDTAILVRAR
jgi:CelD/BcsL family acetyltransferase involved in cellulose biosynthesis